MGVTNNQPRRLNLTNKELVALRKLIKKEIYRNQTGEYASVMNLPQDLQEVYKVLKMEVKARNEEGTLFDKEA